MEIEVIEMAIYVALLRGINVGGHNKIKMADLKRSLEAMGLGRVQTYIQSGNVLFESSEEEDPLRSAIERRIEGDFGIKASVMLRTSVELERIIAQCPYSEREISEVQATATGECLYVAMLPAAPSQEGIQKLSAYETEDDLFRTRGREVYLLFRRSIRDSKLAANLHKLGVQVTVRNWNTTSKLAALAKAMEVE